MANNVNVNIGAVNQKCGLIRQMGMTPGLAGKFFTLSAKHAIKNYNKIKESIDNNPQAPDLFLNRPVRSFDIKSHVVLSQAVETDAVGNVKVVFNPGTDDEAKAAVVAGGEGFGETTTEAIKKALSPNGDGVIFANGKKLLSDVNDLIDGEIAWCDSVIAYLNQAKQTLLNSKHDNETRVNEYYTLLNATTPEKSTVSVSGNSFEVTVEESDE